jgi:Putative MetA-pathway of phenol degradation
MEEFMRRYGVVMLWTVLSAAPAQAQGLRDLIGQLFIFGSGDQGQLHLAGTADPNNPIAVQAHADHFVPAAVSSNGSLIGFLTDAVSTNIANIPINATSSGVTYRFEAGVPVRTSSSPGPIIAERAQTLGRGRVLVGANVTRLSFKTIRGISMDDIELRFTHVNADFAGCDAVFGDDCTLMGVPTLENDFIQMDLALDLAVTATTFVLTYGLHDRIDIGAVLPIISTKLRGTSQAQVVPFGGPTAAHFFAGTDTNPDLFANTSIDGSASGVGDIAARMKISISESQQARFAILGDVRFPTGSEEDLLGSGHIAVRGLGIVSTQFDAFSAHANIGYVYRGGETQNNAVLATVGFDQVMAPWATIALDVSSELQIGESKLQLPEPVVIERPFRRIITPSTIPNIRDDIINASAGFKFTTPSGVTLIANSIWPLNKAGLRTRLTWTAGLEYNF